jgi:predicted Zn-dependent peptidase
VLVTERDTNQSHLRLAWQPKIDPRSLPERAALSVYSTLLGGSMGSRLFDEIREQRGLCYAIRAYGWTHADSSILEVASGLDSTKCLEAYGRIKEIVQELATDGPTEEEVERARAYAAGSTVLALESTNAVARRAAGNKVTYDEVTSPEDSIDALDSVTYDQVRQVAADIGGEPSVACVGPHTVADFE